MEEEVGLVVVEPDDSGVKHGRRGLLVAEPTAGYANGKRGGRERRCGRGANERGAVDSNIKCGGAAALWPSQPPSTLAASMERTRVAEVLIILVHPGAT